MKSNATEQKHSVERGIDTLKPKNEDKKSVKEGQSNVEATTKKKAKETILKTNSTNYVKSQEKSLPTTDEDSYFDEPSGVCSGVDSKTEKFEETPVRRPKISRRVSFKGSGVLAHSRDSNHGLLDAPLTIDYGDENELPRHSIRSCNSDNFSPSPVRRISFLANSIKSLLSMNSELPDLRDQSSGRRTAFASYRGKEENRNFRISKNPSKMKAERIEAFFYNHGMEITLGVLYLAINILAAAHGAYQFTAIGGYITEDNILRVTLPIARAGGRLVTLNCAILLLTACKYLWTCVRTYVAPVLPIGFPIDNIMPKYHRYVALSVIVSGCIIHSLPQIVNYATRSITMDHEGIRIWTFGDGFATKQLLLTGTLLMIIFSTFFVTTLKCFRKTAAGFRWFWFFHMGGVATAYPLLLIHGTCRGRPVFLYFALIPLLLYLFDIAMRRYKLSTSEVLEMITHDDEGQQITELTIKCPKNFVYTPGQYVELNFPPISKREWHPFTIASAPKEDDNDKRDHNLVFYIKNSGRWTEALYNYASSFDFDEAEVPTKIQIRGPHGAPAMNYFEYKHIVVIGSGVGVTPLLSIWKFLVAKGQKMFYTPGKAEDPVPSYFVQNNTFDEEDSDESVPGEEQETAKSKIRLACILLQKLLESMTASMSLLVVFVLGETLTFVLQMFGYRNIANIFGWTLSLLALITHGSTVVVSMIALGWRNYFATFKCWLECTIILSDIVASVALWVSIKSDAEDIVGVVNVQNTKANILYFLFFGFVIALHAIRNFHIFYTTLKPTFHDVTDDDDSENSIGESFRSLGWSTRSRGSTVKQEIYSIDCILINRMYSNMKFATRSLLRPLIEDGLSDLFSMEFYGTREKPKDRDRSQNALISELMGSGHGLDLQNCMCKRVQDDYFHTGRPNWDKIFLKAIAKAHERNPKGESVGVFFCGSPAIAKDLQVAAAEVTARHQFAFKHLDGRACKCKLIVHSENF